MWPRLKPFDHLVLVVLLTTRQDQNLGVSHLFFGDIMEYLSFHGYAGAGARLVTLAELEVLFWTLSRLGELHGKPNKKPSILDGKNLPATLGMLMEMAAHLLLVHLAVYTTHHMKTTSAGWCPMLTNTNAVWGDTVPKAGKLRCHLLVWTPLFHGWG